MKCEIVSCHDEVHNRVFRPNRTRKSGHGVTSGLALCANKTMCKVILVKYALFRFKMQSPNLQRNMQVFQIPQGCENVEIMEKICR